MDDELPPPIEPAHTDVRPTPDGAPEAPIAPSLLADGVPQRLDPSYVAYDRLSGWVGVAVVFALGVVGLGAFWISSEPKLAKLAVLAGAWVALLALLVATTLFLPRKRWERARWTVSRAGLEIRKGVFFRSITNVPRSRVQHTDVTQGPIQRRFGLATFVVHTAGQQHSEVELEGVAFDVAKALRDDLMAAGAGDGA
ncbi:MAG: PH domain-containing protein [Planctomycetes bacterium]|nr:PH domain-containing protein [Planctomycetota bacterium]